MHPQQTAAKIGEVWIGAWLVALLICLGLTLSPWVSMPSGVPNAAVAQIGANGPSPLATPSGRHGDEATVANFPVDRTSAIPAAGAPPGLIAGVLPEISVESGRKTDLTLVGGVLVGLLLVIGLVAWRRR
jgi:hypothetical protein